MFRRNKSKTQKNDTLLSSELNVEQQQQRGSFHTVQQYKDGLPHLKDKKEHDETIQTVRSVNTYNSVDVGFLSSASRASDEGDGDSSSFASLNTDSICATIIKKLELQNTFLDNFSRRSAFVVNQMKWVEDRERSLEQRRRDNQSSIGSLSSLEEFNNTKDDTITIEESGKFNASQNPEEQYVFDQKRIMNKELASFNYKRLLLSVDRTLKQDTLIFPSADSFELFKELREDSKKKRKDLSTNINNNSLSNGTTTEVSDARTHIIPMSYKTEGQGLPLLRMQSPKLSSFRKDSPQLIFRKFKENPIPPQNTNDDTDFETFDYCFVYLKSFSNYHRFIFEFLPHTSSCFKIVMFQASFKPFADFTYKGTRFRVIGTSASNGFHNRYNQQMKLLVIDDDKASLCDDIFNEKPKSGKSGFLRFKKSNQEGSSENVDFDINDATTYINPIPNNQKFVEVLKLCCTNRLSFIPKNLLPFGSLKEGATFKSQLGLKPKKYNDLGSIELYQDLLSTFPSLAQATTAAAPPPYVDYPVEESFLNSTLSVDVDTLVLAVMFNTLREVVAKNSGKNSRVSLNGTKGGVNLGYYQLFGLG